MSKPDQGRYLAQSPRGHADSTKKVDFASAADERVAERHRGIREGRQVGGDEHALEAGLSVASSASMTARELGPGYRPRDEVVELEGESDVLSSKAREGALVAGSQIVVAIVNVSRRRDIEPTQNDPRPLPSCGAVGAGRAHALRKLTSWREGYGLAVASIANHSQHVPRCALTMA